MQSRVGAETELEPVPTPTSGSGADERLLPLDAFRGLTMLLMVLVNGSGPAVYHQFHHAEWDGWTMADTVFPSFLWIVGIAITLSLGRREEQGISRSKLIPRILRRSAILYVLGLFVYLFPDFHFATMRFTGVLQRIAVCYLAAAVIYLYWGVRGRIAWTIALPAAYWLAITLIPVPRFGAGNLTLEGNLAHYIDRSVLGTHNWSATGTWDPEGLLSTLPAIATTLLGVLAGEILKRKRGLSERCRWLLVSGVGLVLSGLICNSWLPINKNIWSPSFALFMAGLDCLVLTGFLWLIEGRGYRRWTQPFVIFGMNAIAVYMISELVPEMVGLFSVGSGPDRKPVADAALNASLLPAGWLQFLYAVMFTLALYGFAWGLYRRKWFLRV